MGKLRWWILIVSAVLAGVLCSDLLCRWAPFRDAAGHLFGRGRLRAIASGTGFYEKDLDREEALTAPELIAAENLRHAARNEQAEATKVDRELSLLRAQFDSEKAFHQALLASGLSVSALRERIAEQLRSLQWLEKQIALQPTASDQECRSFYETHRDLFTQPVRFRAAHLFLAAPEGTPPEVVESKQQAIEALALRLGQGESLPQVAAEASEDEATKSRGGDLGFFSSARMAPEFFSEVEKLRPGQTSKPFRSRLGFHIIQTTEVKTGLCSISKKRGGK